MKKLTLALLSFGMFTIMACSPQSKNSAAAASQPAVATPDTPKAPAQDPTQVTSGPIEPIQAPTPPVQSQPELPITAPPPPSPKTDAPVVAPAPHANQSPPRPRPRSQPQQRASQPARSQAPTQKAALPANSDFTNNVRRITLTVNDRNLAEKVLFKKSERISGTLVEGQLLSSDKVVDSLKKGKTACVFVSENNNFPNKDEVLKSIKVAERLSLTRANLPLRQIEAVLAWKDQFYSLHCEKKGNFKTGDITNALGSSFDVQFLMQ